MTAAAIDVGSWVRIPGESRQTAYRVLGFNKDGSLHVYGGTYAMSRSRTRLGFRALRVERVVPTGSPTREDD